MQDNLAPLRPAHEKLVAGAGIEPARKRLMRPRPFHLATPQWKEEWHGVPVLPRARGVLETLLRQLAPAAHVVCFENVKIGALSRTLTGIP